MWEVSTRSNTVHTYVCMNTYVCVTVAAHQPTVAYYTQTDSTSYAPGHTPPDNSHTHWKDVVPILIPSNKRRPRLNTGSIKGSIANKCWALIRRRVGPVPAWGRGT